MEFFYLQQSYCVKVLSITQTDVESATRAFGYNFQGLTQKNIAKGTISTQILIKLHMQSLN